MEFWFRRESQAQRQQQQQQQQLCIADAFGDDVVTLAVEKGNGVFLGGEDFMVDDLLDLGELETEEEEDDDDERHKETQLQGLGQGGGEEEEKRGKEIVGAGVGVGVGEDNNKPDVSELSLPMHDGAELEWVSRIVDDSLSEFPTPTAAAAAAAATTMAAAEAPNLLVEKLTRRQHQPPPPPPPVLKSKRSKRARTLSSSSSSSSSYSYSSSSYSSSSSCWGGGGPLLLLDALPTSTSSSSSCSSPLSSSPSPLLSSHFILAHHLFDHIPSLSAANNSPFLKKHNQIQNNPEMMKIKSKKKKKKKRGRKPKAAAVVVHQGGKGERRCSHCGVNKTPQWRAGPEGAKTLCNACGVRYKSGRLLPEYRPACSPTFISHIHSNSHRKVMEMRRSKEPQEQGDEQEAKGEDRDRFLLISSVASC